MIATDARIYPKPLAEAPPLLSTDSWGFADTAFVVNPEGHITVTGNRYPGLSGETLSSLLPWFKKVIEIDFTLDDPIGAGYPAPVPPPMAAAEFLEALKRVMPADAISTDRVVRLRHGHGHTLSEIHAIWSGGFDRVPDYVVFPRSEDEVAAIVAAAAKSKVVLVPFGGGTNVTQALRCLPKEDRPIISVDMSRMNRVEWIDPANRMARIQAGTTGREIQSQLAVHGLTLGHEPDSIELSTLGGWIATNASGMKKNKYGNIEQLILDVTAVTPSGKLERSQVVPRESVGLDPKLWLIGSEGSLGIITSAVVKLFPLPEAQVYSSIIFKRFEQGLAFMYDLAQTESYPASVRLVDNLQFQFGQALKPASTGLKKLKSQAEKWLVTGPLGFDPGQMVAVTLVFEGTRREVREQRKRVSALSKRHGGMSGGAENGRRGYMLTFGIAYIRDFVLRHHIFAESFETSVPWSQAQALVDRVKARIYAAHKQHKLPGVPFVSCRVTQVYETGCCVYFYMAFYARGVANALEAYHDIENQAREEILAVGGSISHHHGVGKIRLPFVESIMSPAMIEWRGRMKSALDPAGVFASQLPLA